MSEKRCAEQLWHITDKTRFYPAQSEEKVDKVDNDILSLSLKTV